MIFEMRILLIFFTLFFPSSLDRSQPIYREVLSESIITIGIHNRDKCGIVDVSTRNIEGDKESDKVIDAINAKSIGTGFIYTYENKKYIITCEHVVFKASKSQIRGYDSRTGYEKDG